MDDYSINSLIESKNEWCSRLVTILTPSIIEGFRSIFDEAYKLCLENDEIDKYLMTFQTFLSRVPQWNPSIIEQEKKRIEEDSGCLYLDELIACVHITQLKALTCVRVGQNQKKIDIDVPSINDFLHKIYHNAARKIYTSIYLFEKNIAPLQIQKNNTELEKIIKECIMNTIRENMPIETILKAYIDDTTEEHIIVNEEIIPCEEIEPLDNETIPLSKPNNVEMSNINVDIDKDSDLAGPLTPKSLTEENITMTTDVDSIEMDNNTTINANQLDTEIDKNKIQFNNIDNAVYTDGEKENIYASKEIDDLEAYTSNTNYGDDDDDDEDEILQIGDNINLDIDDLSDLTGNSMNLNNSPILNDIEILS